MVQYSIIFSVVHLVVGGLVVLLVGGDKKIKIDFVVPNKKLLELIEWQNVDILIPIKNSKNILSWRQKKILKREKANYIFSLELTVLKKKLYPLFQLPMSNRNKYQLEFRLHKRQIAKLIHYHFFLPFVWRCHFLTASSYIFNGTGTLPRKCIKWISGLHFEKPDF